MGEADLADEFEAGMLAQAVHGLDDAEHGADDVVAGVAEAPELLEALERLLDLAFPAGFQHGLDLDRVRTVDDLEDVVAAHEAEAGVGALQVVDGLAHVAFGAKDERGDPVVAVADVFRGADVQQARDDLPVGQVGVAEDGAAGLERFDDLVGRVAGEGEPGGGGVDFHGAPESLLRAGCHASTRARGREREKMINFGDNEESGRGGGEALVPVCFIEYDDLLATGGKSDFFLRESFDPVANDVDPW